MADFGEATDVIEMSRQDDEYGGTLYDRGMEDFRAPVGFSFSTLLSFSYIANPNVSNRISGAGKDEDVGVMLGS